MATPLTGDQIKKAFETWGVPTRVVGDPENWSRTAPGWPWGPVHGVMMHHTGDDADDPKDRAVVHDGRPGLSGPLAQFGINDDGVVDLQSFGRANHAGGGDPAVLAAVVAESYTDYPPAPHFHEGSAGQADGNTPFYGFETYYSGAHKPQQYASMVRSAAALCSAHGWTAKSVIGHKEWSDWKPDPGSIDMKLFRADVAWCLQYGPALAAQRFPIDGQTVPVIVPASNPYPPKTPPAPPPAPRRPRIVDAVHISHLHTAMEQDPPKQGTPVGPYGDEVYTLERALVITKWLRPGKDDGHYGSDTVGDGRNMEFGGAKGFQVKHSIEIRGYQIRPDQADGWLGPKEATLLFRLAGMGVRVFS